MRAIYQQRSQRTWAQRALSVVALIGIISAAIAFAITVVSACRSDWAQATFALLLAWLLLESSTSLWERERNQ